MKIEIYSKPGCPYCDKAKKAFENNHYEYTQYTLPKDASRDDIQQRVNALGIGVQIRTVPQIFIDDEYIGGYDDLTRKFDWV